MILNLGCGKKIIAGAVNVDIEYRPGVDQTVDLSKFPWPWSDGAADEIHASHIVEHFPDSAKFMKECRRVLKPGGKLRVVGPHSSCVTSIGCWYHYRTFCWNALDDYLSRNGFRTDRQYINWWYEVPGDNVPEDAAFLLAVLNKPISWLINLSPSVFENLWWPWVGGAREVVWEGKKIWKE